jgi:hypothetical protein
MFDRFIEVTNMTAALDRYGSILYYYAKYINYTKLIGYFRIAEEGDFAVLDSGTEYLDKYQDKYLTNIYIFTKY